MTGGKQILVVGGGAAGMAAAYFAAKNGADVRLLEKNEKTGKKIYITGKGRCNVTNNGGREDMLEHVVSNPRFLRGALQRFDSADLIALIEALGTPLKTERGGRVFPVSDHASDITGAWMRGLAQEGVDVLLHTEVAALRKESDRICGVTLADGSELDADAVIVATGGLSYPTTGSTGDGYRWASALGHSLIPTRPSLLAMTTAEDFSALEGLSLRNVSLKIDVGAKRPQTYFGEMLFTADGISGPIVLTASARAGRYLDDGPLPCVIDLKPAVREEQLDARLVRLFEERSNQSLKNVIRQLLPASMCLRFLDMCDADPEIPVHSVTRRTRHDMIRMLKAFPLTLTGTHGFREAVITQGGIDLKEIDPARMASKIWKDLYFAGEVLDLDAETGGYNLQIAWTTGAVAGMAAAGKE